jgi:hypothetical protein
MVCPKPSNWVARFASKTDIAARQSSHVLPNT